jgi:hypothetical protein
MHFMHTWHKVDVYWESHVCLHVKLKLSLCLTKHHAMKTYWGSGCVASRTLNLGTGLR